MSIQSAVLAEHHNKELKRKAVMLAAAIRDSDWPLAKEVQRWLDSDPFSE